MKFKTTLAIPVCPRPTGGGAVLHCHDLTYAVVAPARGALAGGIIESYATLAAVFGQALEACGLVVDLRRGKARFDPVCFARSAEKELVHAGVKIMGAAQVRRRGCLLQQGVIPLRVDQDLQRRVFGRAAPAGQCGLLDICPQFSRGRFVQALEEAFAVMMDVAFAQGQDDDGQGQHADTGEIDLG